MFRTRLTDLLGTEYPIIGGCMQYITGPEFTASISNAGGLGIMSSAMFRSQGEFRAALRGLKSLTDKPYAVNLNLFPALRPIDNHVYLEIILEEEVPVVEFSGNRPPEDILSGLEEAGVKVLHKCVSVRHALAAQKLGVSAVTLLGSEGGGHIGEAGLTALSLIPQACDALDIPVIAAGGIVDGRTFLAAMALGAEGVQIGTRFMVTEECPIHDNVKSALLAARESDTMRILGIVHNQLRVWRNGAALRVQELEANEADVEEIFSVAAGANVKRLLEDGDVDAGVLACGQNIGIINEVEPVAEVIGKMVREAEDILAARPFARGRVI
jgi:NADH:quinone reductase (non-electrogenic)